MLGICPSRLSFGNLKVSNVSFVFCSPVASPLMTYRCYSQHSPLSSWCQGVLFMTLGDFFSCTLRSFLQKGALETHYPLWNSILCSFLLLLGLRSSTCFGLSEIESLCLQFCETATCCFGSPALHCSLETASGRSAEAMIRLSHWFPTLSTMASCCPRSKNYSFIHFIWFSSCSKGGRMHKILLVCHGQKQKSRDRRFLKR